jgi:hypothetical protein
MDESTETPGPVERSCRCDECGAELPTPKALERHRTIIHFQGPLASGRQLPPIPPEWRATRPGGRSGDTASAERDPYPLRPHGMTRDARHPHDYGVKDDEPLAYRSWIPDPRPPTEGTTAFWTRGEDVGRPREFPAGRRARGRYAYPPTEGYASE